MKTNHRLISIVLSLSVLATLAQNVLRLRQVFSGSILELQADFEDPFMALIFRPQLEGLEARETPTALGYVFLGTVPNPAANASARVIETPETEFGGAPAVDWGMVGQQTDEALNPGALNHDNSHDLVWNEWGEETRGVAENLVSDWVFTERAPLS